MKYVPIFLASGGMLAVAPKQKKGDCAGDFAKLQSIITYPCIPALILHKRCVN